MDECWGQEEIYRWLARCISSTMISKVSDDNNPSWWMNKYSNDKETICRWLAPRTKTMKLIHNGGYTCLLQWDALMSCRMDFGALLHNWTFWALILLFLLFFWLYAWLLGLHKIPRDFSHMIVFELLNLVSSLVSSVHHPCEHTWHSPDFHWRERERIDLVCLWNLSHIDSSLVPWWCLHARSLFTLSLCSWRESVDGLYLWSTSTS